MSKSEREQNLEKLWNDAIDEGARLSDELETTYAHLRALTQGGLSPEGYRHAIVGLLPETRDMPVEWKRRCREKGMGHLVDRHEVNMRQGWADYGYGSDTEGGE